MHNYLTDSTKVRYFVQSRLIHQTKDQTQHNTRQVKTSELPSCLCCTKHSTHGISHKYIDIACIRTSYIAYIRTSYIACIRTSYIACIRTSYIAYIRTSYIGCMSYVYEFIHHSFEY